MDNIINNLIEIDKHAQKIVSDALAQKEEAINNSSNQKGVIKSDYIKRAMDRIEVVKSIENENSRQGLERIENDFKQSKQKLTQLYEQNKGIWRENIIKNCLGR